MNFLYYSRIFNNIKKEVLLLIIDKLINKAKDKCNGVKTKEIRAGLGYTCVVLDNNSSGLAYTFRNEMGACCGLMEQAGKLNGVDCSNLVNWAKETNLLKASIGVATLNAVLHSHLDSYESLNLVDAIDVKPMETFGMIGYFGPIVDRIKNMTKNVYIFERNPGTNPDVLPDWAIDMYLPLCDVVVVTGTAIINKTIDHILDKCKNAREVIILGPTTTLCPEVFKQYNVTMLAGSLVTDYKKALDIVSQGGGTRAMKDCTKQVILNI